MLHAGGNDKILGRGMLQNEPHALNIIFGVAPIAQRAEVAQEELILLPLFDACCCQCDFARDESFAAALTLVVEQNARAAIHVVGLAIFFHNPKAILLGHGIGAVGVEGCVFVLWHLLYFSIQLRGAGLVDAALPDES